jgi:acetyltransferase-like isoleucine patch superfamily enzyme
VRARSIGLRGRLLSLLYYRLRVIGDRAATLSFLNMVRSVGPGCQVRHPFYLLGPEHITIGSGFWAGPGLRLETWDRYMDQQYSPEIVIGDNVIFNFHVHVGAVSRVWIGDDVLVGSHVLITDHTHGNASAHDLAMAARLRPLVSKGPVIIEPNVGIGEGACILSGVRVGRGAWIEANAVVTHDVGAGQLVGGVPARLLRDSS